MKIGIRIHRLVKFSVEISARGRRIAVRDMSFIHACLIETYIRSANGITPCSLEGTLLIKVGNAADNAGLATRLFARPRAGASSSFENFSIAAGQVPSSSLKRHRGAASSGADRTFRPVPLDGSSRFPGSNRCHERFLLLPGAREDTPRQTNSNLCHTSQTSPPSAKPS